jgi:hypothetical protein
MKKIVDALEGLPWIVQLILVILWGVYANLLRLFKSIAAKNILGIVLAAILLACGGFVVLWIIDIICVVLGKKIWWFV